MKENLVLTIVTFVAFVQPRTCIASIVLVAFGKDRVITAADSRETYSDNTYKDTACKIGSYGNKVVFTHVGVASFGVTDFMSEARKAVGRAAASRSSQSIAQQAANGWKDRAAELLQSQGTEQLLSMTKKNGSPQLAAFMFANTEASTGTVSVWHATVTLTGIKDGRPMLESKAEEYGVDADNQSKIRALGHDRIFWEFVREKTPRAMTWRKELEASLQRLPLERKLERTLASLVKLTIDHDPEGVGGNVDELRLDVAKGVRWLHRKPECSFSGQPVPSPARLTPVEP